MVCEGESESLDRLLGQVCRLHHARAHTLLEALGLYRGQPPLLWALAADPGLAHSELAARLHVTPATVSKMVSRMEKLGIVETRDDAEDQRVSRVLLTDAGLALHDQASRVGEQLGAEAFEGFSAEELTVLEGFLRKILGNLMVVQGDGVCGGPNRQRRA
jgi:MarR family transcriptional regulator, organic hydroperoxide resistance regulator